MYGDNHPQRGFAVDWRLINAPFSTPSAYDAILKLQMQRVLDVTQGSRRPLDTTKGHLGIGLPAAEVGDRVCIFLGGRVLYVIRSRDMGTMNS